MFKIDQFSTERVRLAYWGYAEGDSSITVPRHAHDFFQANFTLSGMCELKTAQGNYRLQNHDLVFIAPGVAHELHYPQSYWCCCCKFEGSFPFMPDVLYVPSSEFSRGVIAAAKTIVEMSFPQKFFGKAEGTIILPGDHYQVIMEHYLTGVLNHLLYERHEERVPARIMDILQGNSGGIFTVAEAAAACHYSRNHFTQLIKNATGLTARDFLSNLRRKKAEYLLRYSEQSMAEIARNLGFSNQFHFADFFKRHVGMTPSGYRKKFFDHLFK